MHMAGQGKNFDTFTGKKFIRKRDVQSCRAERSGLLLQCATRGEMPCGHSAAMVSRKKRRTPYNVYNNEMVFNEVTFHSYPVQLKHRMSLSQYRVDELIYSRGVNKRRKVNGEIC